MYETVEIDLLRSTLRGMAERQTICGMEPVLSRAILAVIDRVHPEPVRMSTAETMRRIEMSLEDIRDRIEYLVER